MNSKSLLSILMLVTTVLMAACSSDDESKFVGNNDKANISDSDAQEIAITSTDAVQARPVI